MPRSGALLLSDYPKPMVRLICPRCGRKGQYRKENLIEKYGPAVALPDLLHLISNCERYGKASNPCGVRYGDLIAHKQD